MKKVRQVMAIVGLCLIAVMYIITIVFAVNKSPNTTGFLMAAIACTIIVPVVIYLFQLISRNLQSSVERYREVQERLSQEASEHSAKDSESADDSPDPKEPPLR